MIVNGLITTYLRSPILVRLLVLVFFIILCFGIVIHLIEPEEFPTIFDGVYWAIVTASTVGFGDFVPVSTTGKVLAIFLILTGAGFVTFYMVTVSSSTINVFNSLTEGNVGYIKKDHIIIVGWNERVKHTISYLKKTKPTLSIVLIDQTLKENPYDFNNVHFVKGDGRYDHTLQQANIKEASMILITTNQHENELQADMQSILTLLAVKGLNPSIYSVIEILTPEQAANAKRAGADEIIESNILLSFLMINTIQFHGMSSTFLTILDQLKGSRLKYVDVPEDCNHISFQEGVHHFIKQELLLIGIKRGDESYINPSPQFPIQTGDQLLIIEH